jgi:hypothetical protein
MQLALLASHTEKQPLLIRLFLQFFKDSFQDIDSEVLRKEEKKDSNSEQPLLVLNGCKPVVSEADLRDAARRIEEGEEVRVSLVRAGNRFPACFFLW